MCGIAGFFGTTNLPSARVDEALRALQKRGPDGHGTQTFRWRRGDGAETAGLFLHTRLSIRDLSSNGSQPMANEDASVWIVFNGECYGWETHRAALESRGHVFRSGTDTEFILHGYEEWGTSVLEKLRGMFAFAIFDTKRRRVFCARDRLGKKPFYFSNTQAGFVFASNLSALSALCPEKPEVNPAGIDAYLAHRYIPSPLTIFKGVEKLPPASFLDIDLDAPSKAKPVVYWTPAQDGSRNPLEVLRESVDLRLVADRPVGLFLSGGVDSQSLAAMLRGRSDLSAFTASFDEKDFDEADEARAAAMEYNLRHDILPVRMRAEDLDAIIQDLDEPFADPSAIPMWYLCQAATARVKVALTGDGGDELFGGYKRYRKHLASRKSRLPFKLPQSLLNFAPPWINKSSLGGRFAKILLECTISWQEAYALRFSGMDPATRAFLQPSRGKAPIHFWRLPQEEQKLSPLEWMLECDRLNYLPDYILKKGDLCGMAHGFELRNPLLDHFFFQTVMAMPSKKRFTDPAKALLREVRGHRKAGPKRGFNPPIQDWLGSSQMIQRLNEVPNRLESLTGGQMEARRIREVLGTDGLKIYRGEWAWQLLVLEISLGNLVRN